jgi:hypothetical protein
VPYSHVVTTHGKRVLLESPHKVNVPFSTILNTFHPRDYHSVLNFCNGSWFILSREEELKAQWLIEDVAKRIKE